MHGLNAQHSATENPAMDAPGSQPAPRFASVGGSEPASSLPIGVGSPRSWGVAQIRDEEWSTWVPGENNHAWQMKAEVKKQWGNGVPGFVD